MLWLAEVWYLRKHHVVVGRGMVSKKASCCKLTKHLQTSAALSSSSPTLQFEAMVRVISKTQRDLANVRKQRKSGYTRTAGEGSRKITPEEDTTLANKEEILVRQQIEEQAVKRRKIIVPINTHTTVETDRAMRHMTSEVDRGLAGMSEIAGVVARNHKAKSALITELLAPSSSSARVPNVPQDDEDETADDKLIDVFGDKQDELQDRFREEWHRKVLDANKEMVGKMWAIGFDFLFFLTRPAKS